MVQEDNIKEAFLKVKNDILFLKQEVDIIKLDIKELKEIITNLKTYFNDPTNQQINPTNSQKTPTDDFFPTDNMPFKALKSQYFGISIGNNGVPTDRQTNQQTDRQMQDRVFRDKNSKEDDKLTPLDKVTEMLENLGSIKKELRLKFKRLTKQELVVFSLLYQLDDQGISADYKTLASRLSLTESSVRDYIKRIIEKGIPIKKDRLNNKKILLHIPQELRKIASLSTILQLREL